MERAAGYIYASFGSLSYRVEPHFFSEAGREFRNVIAKHVGVRKPGERLLIISHHDTVEGSPGADDNASGVAALLTDTGNFRNPHYHQPTDTLEMLNVSFAAEVCRAVVGMVVMAAQ